jgi:predicted DNA-binding transcriptional regulator AlpA
MRLKRSKKIVPAETDLDPALDTASAAGLLGIGKSTLDKLRGSGDGPTYVKIGRRVLYPVAWLREYQEKQARISTSDDGSNTETPANEAGA